MPVRSLLLALAALTVALPPHAAAVFSEVTYHNFDQLADGRSFLVILFYSDDPPGVNSKAVTALTRASNAFRTEKEVVFGKVDVKKERVLALRFRITSTPALVFFPYKKEPYPHFGGMDAVTIVQTVTAVRMEGRLFRRVHLNEHLLGQHYTDAYSDKSGVREIKMDEFNREILASKKYILLSLFKEGCKEECVVFEMVARVFRNDENIVFFKIKYDDAKELAKHYQMLNNPTLIWFTPEDKEFGKTYGGLITLHMLVAFINENTGAERDFDGRIHQEAGRIRAIDDFLKEHILELITGRHLDHIYINLKELVREVRAPKRFIDYYLKIVERAKHGRTIDQILEEENNYITKRLSARGISHAERDEWTRFRNIISALVDMAAERLMDDRSSDPAKMAEEMLYQHQREARSRGVKEQAQWVRHSHDEL